MNFDRGRVVDNWIALDLNFNERPTHLEDWPV